MYCGVSDVDWWSLGIVAFELLTGWPPFFDKDFDRMCEKILKKPIRFPGKYAVSVEAQQLIRGFLERNPNNRLGSRKSGGLGSLQAHVFFADTEWDLIERGQVSVAVDDVFVQLAIIPIQCD